ncbi:unnamed protein product [Cyclocybe aegerita]|uniref:PCI domain-containing protein n=1 Tax=Cyclocybe aegerita TaxID=1973307 RepID=A0A8S0WV18_CYCAE|nr:unnamed protein product [Cyclocybe aegerita]
MDHANFSAKLEPFLLMSKSVKGAAAAKLIQDATAAPGVFVFSELLELPNIQELGKSEQHRKFLTLLQLFAFKTYQDYLQHKDALPPLNQAQIIKLKYLTIVSLAAERRILPYADLLKALDISSVRELEDLIIDAIYLDLLQGKLDQKEEQLEVTYTAGRDLEPGKLEQVLAALKGWANTTSAVLTTLDAKINSIAADTAAQKLNQQEHERILQAHLKEVFEKQKEKSMGGGMASRRAAFQMGDRENMMDVDEPDNKGKNRNIIDIDTVDTVSKDPGRLMLQGAWRRKRGLHIAMRQCFDGCYERYRIIGVLILIPSTNTAPEAPYPSTPSSDRVPASAARPSRRPLSFRSSHHVRSHRSRRDQPTANRTSATCITSPQRTAKTYATTAEAIANFKPTSQQVISGIAPHVFDERRRRRSQRRASYPRWYGTNANTGKRPSPLRGAMVISWDEHSIYLEQSDPQRCSTTSTVSPEETTKSEALGPDQHAAEQTDAGINSHSPSVKISKSGRRYFRVDTHLCRTLIVKLKIATTLHPSIKPT